MGMIWSLLCLWKDRYCIHAITSVSPTKKKHNQVHNFFRANSLPSLSLQSEWTLIPKISLNPSTKDTIVCYTFICRYLPWERSRSSFPLAFLLPLLLITPMENNFSTAMFMKNSLLHNVHVKHSSLLEKCESIGKMYLSSIVPENVKTNVMPIKVLSTKKNG